MLAAGFCPRIESIKINLLNTDEVRNISMLQVKTHEAFISNEIPVPWGTYDPRLGPIATIYNCVTCGHGPNLCPGHFGHFKTDCPVLHPIAYDEVMKWLKVICLRCGNLMVDINRLIGKPNSFKLQFAASSQTVEKICSRCGAIHPKLKSNPDNMFYFDIIERGLVTNTMKFKDIQTVLGRIEDSSVIAMGRKLESHPKYYYSDTILVSPITTRPYYKNILTNKSHRTSPTLDFIKNII